MKTTNKIESAAVEYEYSEEDRLRAYKRQEADRDRIHRAEQQVYKKWETWPLGGKDSEIVRIVQGQPEGPARGDGLIPFVIAYREPSDGIDEIGVGVMWADPDQGVRLVEYGYNAPSVLCPTEILGMLTPVPADSLEGLWRELSRRTAVDCIGWTYGDD